MSKNTADTVGTGEECKKISNIMYILPTFWQHYFYDGEWIEERRETFWGKKNIFTNVQCNQNTKSNILGSKYTLYGMQHEII